MNDPKELGYTKSHEWVKYLDDKTALVGVTEYAQKSLGALVFVDLPTVGDATEAGKEFASVESVKAVSNVFCPVTGVVAEVNEALLDAPERINEDPYEAWIAKIEGITGTSEMLDAEAYGKFVETEEA